MSDRTRDEKGLPGGILGDVSIGREGHSTLFTTVSQSWPLLGALHTRVERRQDPLHLFNM